MLIDTHAHIHDSEFDFEVAAVLAEAKAAGVEKILCIGTTVKDSAEAIKFCQEHAQCYPTVGLHPHDAQLGADELEHLANLAKDPSVVAIGECGLDYFYTKSPKLLQQAALRAQLELAQKHHLPLTFHVRDGEGDSAFADFWQILDEHSGVTGVVHSFSSTKANLEATLTRGLYVALNGIMTFTKDPAQLEVAKTVPLERLILETDAPFLTPAPFRGKVNTPAKVRVVAEFLADLRGESLARLAKQTTINATKLFNL